MKKNYRFLSGSALFFVWSVVCFLAAFTPEGLGSISIGLYFLYQFFFG